MLNTFYNLLQSYLKKKYKHIFHYEMVKIILVYTNILIIFYIKFKLIKKYYQEWSNSYLKYYFSSWFII